MKRAILVAGVLVFTVPQFALAQNQQLVGARFTYSFSRIDDRTWEIVIKVNGERRLLVRNVVSEDGKTMRGVSTVTDRGQVNQDVIYEKQ